MYHYTCCLCIEIVTLEDCLLEQWRDFSANLHSQSRNSAFQRLCNPADHTGSSTQKNVSKRSSFYWFSRWLGKRFPFPGSFSCQDVGSQVFTEVPIQRHGSICLSVRIIITAKLILPHIWSDSWLFCTSSQFSRNVETFEMISGSSQLTNYVALVSGFKWGLILDWKLQLKWQFFILSQGLE